MATASPCPARWTWCSTCREATAYGRRTLEPLDPARFADVDGVFLCTPHGKTSALAEAAVAAGKAVEGEDLRDFLFGLVAVAGDHQGAPSARAGIPGTGPIGIGQKFGHAGMSSNPI